MPKTSLYTPYGQLRYSASPSTLQRMVESVMDGVDGAYSEDGAFAADVYASCRVLAAAQATVERVGNHRNPLKTQELLPQLEREYGIVPRLNATMDERRQKLADKVWLREGARYEAVVSGLTDILGSGFVAYRTMTVAESPPIPTTPYTIPGHNVFLPPGTTVKLYRLDTTISLFGSRAVQLTYLSGDQSPIAVGEKLVFEVGRLGLEETVLVQASSGTTVTCDFNTAHGAGCMVRGGTWPRWQSRKRWNLIVVTQAVLDSGELMAEVHEFLRSALRATSTWTVTVETSPGVVGPFVPGTGIPGVTPIEEITL